MKKSIGFIGAGRITKIFLQAWSNKNISLENVRVFDTNNEVSANLKHTFPEIQIDEFAKVAKQEVVFLALHPPVFAETLEILKPFIEPTSIFISLAPKISIEKIGKSLDNMNIVRIIPNATTVINKGYNPVCFAKGFENKADIWELISVFGKNIETDEYKLEAYAIASAMLPTYFWFQWFEMIEISKQMGLSENESIETIKETLISSIETMFDSGLSQKEVIDLIPVKPIGEHESQIKEMFHSKLIGLYNKIKP